MTGPLHSYPALPHAFFWMYPRLRHFLCSLHVLIVPIAQAMTLAILCLSHPMPIAALPEDLRLQIIGAAGAGFPSPAQDWEETATDLVSLLRLDRAACFAFRVSGSSMQALHDVEAGQGDLFACADPRAKDLLTAMDGLNARYGRASVSIASASYGTCAHDTKRPVRSPSWTTRIADVPVAK